LCEGIEANGDCQIGEDELSEFPRNAILLGIVGEEPFVVTGARVEVIEEFADPERGVGRGDYGHVEDRCVAGLVVGDSLAFEQPSCQFAEWAYMDRN